ncbi:MAG: glycosyltransferase family 61 protein, partial [Kiritimatiellae bacterium]|nr:glycosyltransferase family 61 protein [Kiritimatiellia bacterium]
MRTSVVVRNHGMASAVSSGFICLWPACSVTRQPPLNYDEDRERLSYLELCDEWGPVYLREFHHTYVSPYGVLFRRGRIVPESVDYSRSWDRNAPTFYKKIAFGRIKRCPGCSVVIHNSYYKNYYHWTLEALPRLYLVRDRISRARLLLCADVEPFHLQSLEFFRLNGMDFIQRREVALADEVLLPTPVNARYGQHNPGLLREMAAWFRWRVAEGGKCLRNDKPRRVYIVRGPDKPRRL